MKGSAWMRNLTLLIAVVFLLAFPALAADPSPDTGPGAPTILQDQDPMVVTVVVRHRVAAAFADTIEAVCGTGEQYWIGDTEYSLEIVRFLPDFGINEAGDIIERSTEAHNPSCEVVIYKDGVEEDRIWSFFGTGAPHFRRESILAVDLVAIPWHGAELSEPIPREAK